MILTIHGRPQLQQRPEPRCLTLTMSLCSGNFTFGPEGRDNHIHVIDFGFAAVLPQRNNSCPASFCGTPDYASRNAMMGTHPHGAKDDVESLVYTLLDFHLRGEPGLQLSRRPCC